MRNTKRKFGTNALTAIPCRTKMPFVPRDFCNLNKSDRKLRSARVAHQKMPLRRKKLLASRSSRHRRDDVERVEMMVFAKCDPSVQFLCVSIFINSPEKGAEMGDFGTIFHSFYLSGGDNG